jgi:hypothetical protein
MWLAMHTAETFPAIYCIQNAPTEPMRLQLTLPRPHVAQQALVSRGSLKLYQDKNDKILCIHLYSV